MVNYISEKHNDNGELDYLDGETILMVDGFLTINSWWFRMVDTADLFKMVENG